MSAMMHLTGIHCNTNKEAVKLPMTEFVTNANILFYEPDQILKGDTLSICYVHPDKCGHETDCFMYAEETSYANLEFCNISNISQPNCKYYLKGAGCHNCSVKTFTTGSKLVALFTGEWYDVCNSDAYPYGSDNDKDFWSECTTDACVVPNYYYFNFETGVYVCTNTTICGTNSTYTNNFLIDEKLENAGAELLYNPNEDKYSYNKLIFVDCNANLDPRLTFFGVDVFDYKIWLLLSIIYIAFLGLSLYKNY